MYSMVIREMPDLKYRDASDFMRIINEMKRSASEQIMLHLTEEVTKKFVVSLLWLGARPESPDRLAQFIDYGNKGSMYACLDHLVSMQQSQFNWTVVVDAIVTFSRYGDHDDDVCDRNLRGVLGWVFSKQPLFDINLNGHEGVNLLSAFVNSDFNPGITKMLLAAGADPNYPSREFGNPIHFLTAWQTIEDFSGKLTALIEAGADILVVTEYREWKSPIGTPLCYQSYEDMLQKINREKVSTQAWQFDFLAINKEYGLREILNVKALRAVGDSAPQLASRKSVNAI